ERRHAQEESAWAICRCDRLEPRDRTGRLVVSDDASPRTAAIGLAATGEHPVRIATRSWPRHHQSGDPAMKSIILSAAALAFATPFIGQPAPAGVAPVTAAEPIIAPAPKATTHRTRPPSPAEQRVRAANRAATMEPLTGGYLGG